MEGVLQAVSGFMDQEQPAQERRRTRRKLQLYIPAVTANWRLRLLRKGNMSDAELANIRQAHAYALKITHCMRSVTSMGRNITAQKARRFWAHRPQDVYDGSDPGKVLPHTAVGQLSRQLRRTACSWNR